MWKQKGQGIVEYALILAFIVGIGGRALCQWELGKLHPLCFQQCQYPA